MSWRARQSPQILIGMHDKPPLLTLPAAAQIVEPPIPVKTLRRWVADGRLPAYRPGRRVLVRREDLLALIESAPVTGPVPERGDSAA